MSQPTPSVASHSESILEPNLIASKADGGRIADNILNFVRLLRAAGLDIGPAQTIVATEAVLAAGIERTSTLYWALHASLVTRPEQSIIFNQAFMVFWKDPGFLEQMLSIMLPKAPGKDKKNPDEELSRRLRDPLMPQKAQAERKPRDDLEIELTLSFSDAEILRTKDFEQMSAREQQLARMAIARMALAMEEMRTRRFQPSPRADRIDLRAILREAASKGPDHLALKFKTRRKRRPPLVIVCDISGSMDAYARMLLHFFYALTNARDRVHVFLFGTRLTNITRSLKGRDPDQAISKVSGDVKDWSGGTRLGQALSEFNRLWARRVLGQNASVLLITDGLDREGGEGIAVASRRLKASARRLIWLNPLLRYDGYEPLALGAAELKGNVSELRACHNLASLEELTKALASRSRRTQGPKVRRLQSKDRVA